MLNIGDVDLRDLIKPHGLDDIERVVKKFSHRLLKEKRKKQRNRVNTSRGSSCLRKEARDGRPHDGRCDVGRHHDLNR